MTYLVDCNMEILHGLLPCHGKGLGRKFEVSLVEERGHKKGEEQELSVWQESISSQGERWFGGGNWSCGNKRES